MQESIIVNHPSILIVSAIIVGIIGYLNTIYNKPINRFVGKVLKQWWLEMMRYKWSIIIGAVTGCAVHYLVKGLV
jgi:hypothetical protein